MKHLSAQGFHSTVSVNTGHIQLLGTGTPIMGLCPFGVGKCANVNVDSVYYETVSSGGRVGKYFMSM